MLIVEGCDNSGKSTLVRRLSEDAKLLVVANKRRPKTKDDAFNFLNLAIPLSKRFPTIFDRWTPISEKVYGHIIRGKTIFSDRDFEVAQAAPLLAGLKPILIYCRPPDEVIAGTIDERQQMEGVTEQLQALIRAYDRTIDHWSHDPSNSYPTIRFNYRDPKAYGLLLDRVSNHLKERYQ